MTENADTQVDGAPDSQKSETPKDSQPQEAQVQTETRTPEQVEQSISFQQSRADKAENLLKERDEKIEGYQYLEVIDKQLKQDNRFQQDLNGAWSLKAQNQPADEVDGEDFPTNASVKDMVKAEMQPILQSLGLLSEQSKAKEMGIEATSEELIKASNTPMTAAQILDYKQLKAVAANSKQEGADGAIKDLTGQIQNAQSTSASIANANSVVDTPEEPKTQQQEIDDTLIESMKKRRNSGIEVISI